MTVEAIRNAITRVISDSKFKVDFINDNTDGSLNVKVSRPMKHNYPRTIKGTIRGEEDIGMFQEALMIG